MCRELAHALLGEKAARRGRQPILLLVALDGGVGLLDPGAELVEAHVNRLGRLARGLGAAVETRRSVLGDNGVGDACGEVAVLRGHGDVDHVGVGLARNLDGPLEIEHCGLLQGHLAVGSAHRGLEAVPEPRKVCNDRLEHLGEGEADRLRRLCRGIREAEPFHDTLQDEIGRDEPHLALDDRHAQVGLAGLGSYVAIYNLQAARIEQDLGGRGIGARHEHGNGRRGQCGKQRAQQQGPLVPPKRLCVCQRRDRSAVLVPAARRPAGTFEAAGHIHLVTRYNSLQQHGERGRHPKIGVTVPARNARSWLIDESTDYGHTGPLAWFRSVGRRTPPHHLESDGK